MPTLMETIHRWADGQNRLIALDPAERESLQTVIDHLVQSLRQHCSLAELAGGYYADSWTRRIGEEFSISPSDTDLLRDAAHWQRFMEIRHPRMVRK